MYVRINNRADVDRLTTTYQAAIIKNEDSIFEAGIEYSGRVGRDEKALPLPRILMDSRH